jgi:general secretion pathway protein B
MSYILDALRKADAERERDPARGIHARPGPGLAPHAPAGVPAWLWPAAVVAAGIVGAGLIWQQRSAPVPSRPVAIATAPAVPVVQVVPVVPAAAVTPPAPAPLPAPAPERAITKVVATPVSAPPVIAQPVPAAPVAAARPAAPAPAADRVHAVAELPADVQRELPKLAISGGVHSENAAQRMLVVGGQVLSEGAEVAPGVVLEQIRAGNAVLRFRGYRYSVGY